MKQFLSLLLFFTFSISFAQIQKLREFSSGNFIDARIINEEGTGNVFGYFLLYEFDRKSKEIYDMEYVILDKNLNKITSGIFTQSVYKMFLVKTGARLTFVKKVKNNILFGLHDNVDNIPHLKAKIESDYFHERYRKISLDDFTYSNEFVFKDSKLTENEYSVGDSFKLSDLKDNQSIYPTNSEYFVIFAPSEYTAPTIQFDQINYQHRRKAAVRSFSVLDASFNILWSQEINSDKKNTGYYRYRASDENTLVIEKRKLSKKAKELSSYKIYDLASGKFIGKVTQEDPNYKMSLLKMELSEDKLIIYNYLYQSRSKKYLAEETLGYARQIIDKFTGKELKRDYLLWEDLNPHLSFKGKFGDIPKYGKILFQDFIRLKNGNTIGIAEGYKMARNSRVLDLYVMEFGPDLRIKQFQKIEKTPNILKYELSGQHMYSRNDFDYYYSQKLDDDDNYVILYSNNEKEGDRYQRKKDPSWVFGIITYVDGEFEIDKLQLTTDDGMIVPIKAKNGFILLQEYSEKKGVEMRLERINY